MSTTKRSTVKKKKKNNKPVLILFFISLTALIIISVFYYNDRYGNNSADKSLSMSVDNIVETSPAEPDYIKSAGNEYSIKGSDYSYPDSFYMDIPYISQYPELPTGCEITSLTEVLHYLGYSIDKEELARNYLEMKDVATKGCFVEYFWGSPWKTSGSGCFAPAIANAANAFFKANKASHSAYIMSYQSPEMLYAQLAANHPVIVWTCFDYNVTEIKYNEVVLDDGTVFTWPRNEHCVVLSGYDIDNRTVTLADPTYGIVDRDMDKFEDYYKKYYYQAVVIE